MSDDNLEAELEAYLQSLDRLNLDFVDVSIHWVMDNPDFGALHIKELHNVTTEEVEEVLFEIPPNVEAKQSIKHSSRTVFYGATRAHRWLFIACEDFIEENQRILRPITAFEPEQGRAYWESK